MVRTLKGHGHWVNTLALSSEYALRTGPHDHHGRAPADPIAAKQARTAAESRKTLKPIEVSEPVIVQTLSYCKASGKFHY